MPSEYKIVLLPALSRYSQNNSVFQSHGNTKYRAALLSNGPVPASLPIYPRARLSTARSPRGPRPAGYRCDQTSHWSFFWSKMLKCLGKTATLQHHLASVNIPHAFIHCVEVYQPRLLFQVGGSRQEKASFNHSIHHRRQLIRLVPAKARHQLIVNSTLCLTFSPSLGGLSKISLQ